MCNQKLIDDIRAVVIPYAKNAKQYLNDFKKDNPTAVISSNVVMEQKLAVKNKCIKEVLLCHIDEEQTIEDVITNEINKVFNEL